MDIKVLLQAVNQPWFIQPEAAEHYALLMHKLITGDTSTFTNEEPTIKEYAFVVNAAGKKIGSVADAVDNGVAVLNIRGAIMKYDYCGSAGTQTMIRALDQANENPSISAIVLQIDSPGGSVAGTQQFADAIKNSAKPVVAYVNGTMCSAAMWIGSAASKRIASSNTDTIGSIGTMASWDDYKGYRERLGIKSHEVYATDSTHKNIQFREANGQNADGVPNYEPLIKTWLDPLNNEFQNAIQQNLPGIDKTALNGSNYIATEAKAKGLIDKVGTFDDAVKSALQLAKKQKQIKSQNTMKWNKILAFLGFASIVSAQDVKLEDSQMDSLEAAFAEKEQLAADLAATKTELESSNQKVADVTAELATATASLQTVNDELATTKGSLTTANATIETQKARITELEARGGTPAVVVKVEDEFVQTSDTKKYMTSFDKMAEGVV